MLSTIRFFISAYLIFFAFLAHGQEKKVAKPKKDYSPTGFRVGTDLIDIGKTISGNTFTGWEVNGDVDFHNYYLTVDVGTWGKDILIKNGDYTNSGTYYRVGIDVNFLGNDPDKNMFFLGFRAGHSSFNESVTYLTTPPHLFSPLNTTSTNPSASGSWGELTTGLRVKIWKGLWLGYTARMKFAPSVHGSPHFATYDMPGYGVIQNSPWWGFNYQIFWRFAWRKDKVIPAKK
jgi:Domain of unknown function (DUF6048)